MPWSRVSTFADPLSCQSALQSTARAEILPAARGHFRVDATQVGLNALRIQRFMVARPLVSTVEVAPDRTSIGFLTEGSSSNLQHCGVEVTPDDILVYGYDVVHQRSESNFRYGTMSVAAEDFPVLCKAIIGREFAENPPASIVRPDPALRSRLLTLHRTVGQLAHDTPELLELPEVRRALEENLVHVMIRSIAEGTGVETTTGDHRHHAIIGRFEDFLAAHPNRPLYLTEICAGLGVAERTLRAACEEHLGMGPIRFLTLRRMHLAHRALLSADAGKTNVTRIVTDLGFWELGRFSVAYRAMFGEPPSETLRRPAERPEINLRRPSSIPTVEMSARPNYAPSLSSANIVAPRACRTARSR
jgi:AraC-like DNA-binding protein